MAHGGWRPGAGRKPKTARQKYNLIDLELRAKFADEVVARRKGGESWSDIAQTFGVVLQTIQRWVKAEGLWEDDIANIKSKAVPNALGKTCAWCGKVIPSGRARYRFCSVICQKGFVTTTGHGIRGASRIANPSVFVDNGSSMPIAYGCTNGLYRPLSRELCAEIERESQNQIAIERKKIQVELCKTKQKEREIVLATRALGKTQQLVNKLSKSQNSQKPGHSQLPKVESETASSSPVS